jgi:antitoxin component of MazEF toxin-antitoxin module
MALYSLPPATPGVRRIGNATVGIIEVKVLGGLTLEEDETIAELTDTGSRLVVLAAQKAQAIALAEGISDVEAYRIIEDSVFARTLEEAAHRIAIRHAEAIAAVEQAYKDMGTLRRRATVTAILRHRLGEPNIPAGFPRVLFDGLAALAEEEQAAEKLPSEPMTAEALGKPPEATPAKRKRTGARSSGS